MKGITWSRIGLDAPSDMRISLARCVWKTELRCSTAIQRQKQQSIRCHSAQQKENSMLYLSELDSDKSSKPLPGLSCITKTFGVTANELNDHMQDNCSEYPEKMDTA